MIRRDALLQTYVREKALRSIISSAHGKSSRLFNSTESHAILPVETVLQQPARGKSVQIESRFRSKDLSGRMILSEKSATFRDHAVSGRMILSEKSATFRDHA